MGGGSTKRWGGSSSKNKSPESKQDPETPAKEGDHESDKQSQNQSAEKRKSGSGEKTSGEKNKGDSGEQNQNPADKVKAEETTSVGSGAQSTSQSAGGGAASSPGSSRGSGSEKKAGKDVKEQVKEEVKQEEVQAGAEVQKGQGKKGNGKQGQKGQGKKGQAQGNSGIQLKPRRESSAMSKQELLRAVCSNNGDVCAFNVLLKMVREVKALGGGGNAGGASSSSSSGSPQNNSNRGFAKLHSLKTFCPKPPSFTAIYEPKDVVNRPFVSVNAGDNSFYMYGSGGINRAFDQALKETGYDTRLYEPFQNEMVERLIMGTSDLRGEVECVMSEDDLKANMPRGKAPPKHVLAGLQRPLIPEEGAQTAHVKVEKAPPKESPGVKEEDGEEEKDGISPAAVKMEVEADEKKDDAEKEEGKNQTPAKEEPKESSGKKDSGKKDSAAKSAPPLKKEDSDGSNSSGCCGGKFAKSGKRGRKGDDAGQSPKQKRPKHSEEDLEALRQYQKNLGLRYSNIMIPKASVDQLCGGGLRKGKRRNTAGTVFLHVWEAVPEWRPNRNPANGAQLYVVGPEGKQYAQNQEGVTTFLADLATVGENCVWSMHRYNKLAQAHSDATNIDGVSAHPPLQQVRMCFVSGLRYKHPSINNLQLIAMAIQIGIARGFAKINAPCCPGLQCVEFAYDKDVFKETYEILQAMVDLKDE